MDKYDNPSQYTYKSLKSAFKVPMKASSPITSKTIRKTQAAEIKEHESPVTQHFPLSLTFHCHDITKRFII